MGFSFLTQELAMDLGTANTVIFQNDEIVLDEPSIIAIDNNTGKPIALGQKAKLMHEKVNPSIKTIRPLKDGVIADFNAAEMMIRGFIKEVNSRKRSLFTPNLKIVEKTDTAGSAREIAENHLLGHAAVCGKYAAELYGLHVLEEGIETNKRNFTRFLILADPVMAKELTAGQTIDKASLVFTLPHTQGSLAKILTIFSFYDINLSKIQSIPIIGREWEYRFFINLTFDDYVRYRQSIEAVRPLISDFKILGEYAHYE